MYQVLRARQFVKGEFRQNLKIEMIEFNQGTNFRVQYAMRRMSLTFNAAHMKDSSCA